MHAEAAHDAAGVCTHVSRAMQQQILTSHSGGASCASRMNKGLPRVDGHARAELLATHVIGVHVRGDRADVVLDHVVSGTHVRTTAHAVRESGRWVVADTGSTATVGRLRAYRVPSEAMAPTLKVGTTVLVDPASYRAASPAVGDVVTLHPPAGAETNRCMAGGGATLCTKATASAASSVVFVKRIVAGPGDRIAIRAGHVIRNRHRADEPYISDCGNGTGCDFPRPITVPAGQFYVLGDNRGASDDSRFWGPVPARWIIGKVVRRLR